MRLAPLEQPGEQPLEVIVDLFERRAQPFAPLAVEIADRPAQPADRLAQFLLLGGIAAMLALDPFEFFRRDQVDRADSFARGGQPVERFGFGIAVRHILFGETESCGQQRRRLVEPLARNARHFRAAGILVLGLVGQLGAALARGQGLGDMRFGLAVSVGIGVLITAAILVVGTALDGAFSFQALGTVLAAEVGVWARTGAGIGLLAAGISSAVTAPLAAALTARGLFGDAEAPAWHARGWRFRGVWGGILLIGLGFGLADIRPAPAILAAQAFNGALLPLVALFLLAAMNDAERLGTRANGLVANAFGLLVVGVASMLGLTALARVIATVSGTALPAPGLMLPAFALIGVFAGRAVTRRALR